MTHRPYNPLLKTYDPLSDPLVVRAAFAALATSLGEKPRFCPIYGLDHTSNYDTAVWW